MVSVLIATTRPQASVVGELGGSAGTLGLGGHVVSLSSWPGRAG